jgi:hypothetical protein
MSNYFDGLGGDFENQFANFFARQKQGTPAFVAGVNGSSYKCETKRELADWFRGFATACKK